MTTTGCLVESELVADRKRLPPDTAPACGAGRVSFLEGARGSARSWTTSSSAGREAGRRGIAVTVLGGFFGVFLAGYTGVLLSVTNRPIWADTTLLGLVLLISGASTSATLLMLLGGSGPGREETATALARFDRWMLVLELMALVALVASLGVVARARLNAWGGLLVVGVVARVSWSPWSFHA